MHTDEFTLRFELANDAFAGAQLDRANEISRLLRETADRVDVGETDGSLFDINGNKVGSWRFDQIEVAA